MDTAQQATQEAPQGGPSPGNSPAPNCSTNLCFRPKEFHEMTVDEKLDYLYYSANRLREFEQFMYKMNQHCHGPQGQVMVPINSSF